MTTEPKRPTQTGALKPWAAFLLVVAVLVLASIACDTEEQADWLEQVNARQRAGLPLDEEVDP